MNFGVKVIFDHQFRACVRSIIVVTYAYVIAKQHTVRIQEAC